MLVTTYTNPEGRALEIPLIQKSGTDFLVSETGELFPFEDTLQDATLGTLKWQKTEDRPTPLPRPIDHARERAIANFKTLYDSSFASSDDERFFIGSHTDIEAAFNTNFAAATVEELAAWSKLVKQSTTQPEFTRYELTQKFVGPQVGDVLVGDLLVHGSAANWDQLWTATCYRCGAKLGDLWASTILKMKRDCKSFNCGRPCIVAKGASK
jgi:hypothetical protein